ncbi:MAG: PEP-CTERM sorting domain-containing protein [Planctomycetota bacterium]
MLDLEYDGATLVTAGGRTGDPLDAVTFRVDGATVGTLTDDVSAIVSIPVVIPAPASSPGVSFATSTGIGGFDLFFGSESLLLNVDEVEIIYTDAVTVQFVFGAEASAEIASQDLPFGLELGDPVQVSFSAQLTSGDFSSFTASGTGEVEGVPEPSAALLAGAALGLIALRRNRQPA